MAHQALENLVAEMTLSDLAARSGRSVSQIVEFAMGRAMSNGAPATTAPSSATKSTRTRKVDTRTAAGRAAYDAVLLGALKTAGKPTGAAKLRKLVGGSPTQARAALNRLIEQGETSFEGRARATKYSAV